ncbi:MAG: saccharopine dehydrogenase NADP-binding domain-containing protein [Pseudomonadota bacterium]
MLPLLLRHIEMPPERLTVVTRSAGAADVARAHGVRLRRTELTPANCRDELAPLLHAGDFLLAQPVGQREQHRAARAGA